MPALVTLGPCTFDVCKALRSINLPVATTIEHTAFRDCTSLNSVSLPMATTISSQAFDGCNSLTSIQLPLVIRIGSSAFNACTRLTQIYLGASTVCTLSNSNAFSNAGIWSNKGSIFVPASLVDAYKTATNWAFFSNRIFSIT